MDRGYIKIFRKLFRDHEFWKEKRIYSKAEAWIDLLQSARWKDEPEKLIDKRGSYILELGDIYISDRYLAKRWRWSTKKVRNFLTYLIERESIKYKIRSSRRTIITIINLKSYLGWGTTEGITEEPQRNHRGITEESKKKKDKKEKPVKPDNILPDFIPKEAWEGFVEMRKKIKSPITDYAVKRAINKLKEMKEAGEDIEKVLDQSTMANWKGLFPVKDKQGRGRELTTEEKASQLS